MTGFFRYPALSEEHLAFVCEDSLFIVGRDGGVARRLTTDLGEVRRPAFSPDGKTVAFASNVEGTYEVYVMPVEGGLPRRLTFEGANAWLSGFRSNGKILFHSARDGAFASHTSIFEIGLDGTGLQRLPVGWALHVSLDAGGDRVAIGRNQLDNARWKRYRGGTSGEIWTGSLSERSFRRIDDGEGNSVLPTFVGERVFFLCDRDGYGNVWSMKPDGTDLTQHTFHRDTYARNMSAHGSHVVYQCGGEIWRLDASTNACARVPVETRPSGVQLGRKFVEPEAHLQEIDLSRDGKQLAMTVRGKLVVMAAWGGAARQIGARSGVRYRNPAWLAKDREIVVISDEGGEEAPEVFDVASGRRVARFDLDVRRIKHVAANPTRRAFAASDIAGKLVTAELRANGSGATTKVISEGARFSIRDLAWSCDGRFLAFVEPVTWLAEGGIVHLHDTKTGRTEAITTPELTGHSPAFDASGRFLYILSERTFNPVLSPVSFGALVPLATRVYAYVLRADDISPFDGRWGDLVETEEKRREKEKERKKGRGRAKAAALDDDEDPPEPVEVDFDGLADRLVEFPEIEPGTYSSLRAAEYKVLFSSHPLLGMLDEHWSGAKDEEHLPDLVCYDLKESKSTTVLEGIGDFQVRGERTLVRAPRELHLLETGEKPPEDPPQTGHNRHTGTIDLDRVKVEVIPGDEWRQMFVESWRLQRDHFWTESMAGIDWPGIRDRYLPLLDRVATRAELSDLIWELQGELGTSHAYEFGGDYPDRRSYPVGNLGADLRWDGRGYRVERIPAGDAWDVRARSPLTAPGVNVRVGDRIVAVNGRPLSESEPPAALLVHEAESDVELTVEGAQATGRGARAARRQVIVRTLGSERRLRYRDWVARNREHVLSRSDGQLGYLHVPDMQGPGLAEFLRSLRSETRRAGLVVDVRDNGGGFVSQLVIEVLRRRVIGYEKPRYGPPDTYPYEAVRGPIVAICDQFAGSDGDIFSHAFKTYEIGPLVGTRTWGGVIGIDVNAYLADGTLVTQPEYSSYFEGVGWNVENHGVDPDIEVVLDPASMARGEDPQLERAIAEAMKGLEERPVREPEWPAVPSRRF